MGLGLCHRTTMRMSWQQQCRRSVERLFQQSGAGALRREAPLQRYLRDILAVGQHPGVNIDIAGPMYGKALLENPDWRVGE